MEIRITKKQLITGLAVFAAGVGIGVIGYHIFANDKVHEFRNAKSAFELAKQESTIELNKLKATKREYQDEIKPEIEARIRKELQTYISQAETSYLKAKELQKEAQRDREMADLKLELAKTLSESVTHTEKETKIIVKAVDDAEAELK